MYYYIIINIFLLFIKIELFHFFNNVYSLFNIIINHSLNQMYPMVLIILISFQ